MTFCREQLHRLPEEIDLPVSRIYAGIIAFEAVEELRRRELQKSGG